ncbi:MAG: GIY-YIG nuclease family protein [Patescibacteria group bacterium]
MYKVYAIYNQKNDKFYIGQTRDLSSRLYLHNDKIFKGYTAKFDGGWELVYSESCPSRVSALKREKQLKSYRGREFVKDLIYSRVAQR